MRLLLFDFIYYYFCFSELANQRPNKKSKNCMVMMSSSPDIPWSQYKQPHDSGINIFREFFLYTTYVFMEEIFIYFIYI